MIIIIGMCDMYADIYYGLWFGDAQYSEINEFITQYLNELLKILQIKINKTKKIINDEQ